MSRLRGVIDTNVLISAALSLHGSPRRAIDRIDRDGIFPVSATTFAEFVSRIRRSKFDRYVDEDDREEYIAWILGRAESIDVQERITACRDPKDDQFLEVAVNGRADVLVSGDKDLLDLHPFRGIPILRPAAFLKEDRW